jgi:sensor histidine kinase YesM
LEDGAQNISHPSEAMMNVAARLPPQRDRYVRRVVRALGWRRLAVVVLMTFLWSTRRLFSSDMMDFFSPAELALLGLELYGEMAVIAGTLMLGYTLLDEALPDDAPLRLVALCALLLTLSVVLTALLYAYYGHTFNDLPPPVRLFADSLRWGLPAVVLAAVAEVHERAIRTQAAAHAEEQSRLQLSRDETEQQLALLQAQIEPHFLFNVLGSVRRLYRTQPQAGAHTAASLLRYLREALPQLRNQHANLGHELELVRAYLDLFQVRMGERLGFTIEADRSLHDWAFPPMLLVTLVENAIKHGIEPSGTGGHVTVRARRNGETVEVAVLDDGVGFGGAATDGTGVGLVNVRRQLKARYGNAARLMLESREPRGASATLVIPLTTVAVAAMPQAVAVPA